MSKPKPVANERTFRRVILRGMAILLPSVLTLWILWAAFVFVYNNVAEPINAGLRRGVMTAMPLLPEAQRPAWYAVTPEDVAQYRRTQSGQNANMSDAAVVTTLRTSNLTTYWDQHWYLRAAGLVVAITLIWLAGLFLGGFVGRRVYATVERIISRIPGFKQIYPHVKQLVDMILGDRPMAFSRVVLVEFPRPGSWAMAFVTSKGLRSSTALAGADTVCVFVPTTPTPFTGFTLNVPADQVVDLPISIDEAIRYVITGGVLVPGGEQQPLPMPREPEVPASKAS